LGLDAFDVEAFMADLWAEYLGTPNEELIASVRGLEENRRLGILSNSFVGAREPALYHFDDPWATAWASPCHRHAHVSTGHLSAAGLRAASSATRSSRLR
jgi:hypothetical protein